MLPLSRNVAGTPWPSILAVGSGAFALKAGGLDLAGVAGAVGMAFGFASLWFGYEDVTTIYGKG